MAATRRVDPSASVQYSIGEFLVAIRLALVADEGTSGGSLEELETVDGKGLGGRANDVPSGRRSSA